MKKQLISLSGLIFSCRSMFPLLLLISLNAAAVPDIKIGASRTGDYLPLLKNKKVALLVNQTSVIGNRHLVDTFLSLGIKVKQIFAPEHGFRGDYSAGEKVKDSKDPKTQLPVISLYGNNKKPKASDMKGLDYVVFDVQDVGARFYTYISTLHYIMESCAENKVKLLLLDRPNPNGYYIDGPVLDTAFRSFIGMHPVPVVHGMSIGEYASMINGEGWLKGKVQCDLTVVKCLGWDHDTYWYPPVKPSPNLPTWQSICLYPSLCFFEGTAVSVGRGTAKPFESFGCPWLNAGSYRFTPVNIAGVAENPPFLNQECRGFLLTEFCENYIQNSKKLYLDWLLLCYNSSKEKDKFFTPFFDLLAGGTSLREQIQKGLSAEDIRKSWEPGLDKFRRIRSKYLLYPEYTVK